jgi:hypothetical protein
MGPFRQVEGVVAGPSALGVLVPPAKRTFLILRPRSLPFDLLLLRDPAASDFRVLGKSEATAAVRRLVQTLEEGAWFFPGRITSRPAPDGQCWWVQADVGGLLFLACAREEGRPYRPLAFTDPTAANAAAADLANVLCPTGEQELYVNTNHFAV